MILLLAWPLVIWTVSQIILYDLVIKAISLLRKELAYPGRFIEVVLQKAMRISFDPSNRKQTV